MESTHLKHKLIAFDQSTKATGWCLMYQHNSEIIERGVILPEGTTNERIRKTVKQCMYLCDKHQVTFVFIEGIQLQGNKLNPVVYEVLAALKGTLEICLEEKGFIVNVIKSSEWRKRVGIKSRKRADLKAEAIQMVADLYGIHPTEDECEAILFARAFSEQTQPIA